MLHKSACPVLIHVCLMLLKALCYFFLPMSVGIDTDFSLFQLNTVISAAPPFPVLHTSDSLTHESHCSLESHGVTYRNVLRESIMPSSGGFKKKTK